MDILLAINSYIKYVYMALAVVLIVVLIKLLKQLAKIGETVDPILDNIDGIYDNIDDLDKKSAIIENSLETSVPFFVNIFICLSLANAILKDFHETKNSKRSFRKSFSKIVKYQKKIDPDFSVVKLGQSIMNTKH